ncbi:hypothetical protein B296_00058433 [Ensete ventricosum]|uniref:Uncharacterized protein n=1 Tax=Ensete ventricosum TaxID=4639 RepID=A0A426WVI5_ENSVE|nr:hypothetical protein B296_00058433 [Ensete ventricosum]
MFHNRGSVLTKVGNPATFMLVVRFGGSGSIGRLTRSAMPPHTCPRRRPSWSAD